MSAPVDLLAVIESCRDRDGLLNDTGRVLAWTLRKEREWRACGMTECADEARDSARSIAFNYKAQADSLRGACAVPITANRRPFRRRTALARVVGAA